MNSRAAVAVLLRILLTAAAVLASVWVVMPRGGNLALGILGIVSTASHTPAITRRKRLCAGGLAVAWLSSLVVVMEIFRMSPELPSDSYYCWLAALIAATMLPPGGQLADGPLKNGWKILGLSWITFGCFVWLVESYTRNSPWAFYLGLLSVVALLIFGKFWLRLPPFLVQTVNVLILLSIGLPAADWLTRMISAGAPDPRPEDKLYLYENAKRNPAGFVRWWGVFDSEWAKAAKEIFVFGPTGIMLLHPRPNSRATFFQCPISINSLGFRGREIARDKANAYRIVALGESTTFGLTMNVNDKPWPQLLEEMIQQRLKPPRPVEVINAGIPACDLKGNLYRLRTEILPLKPDMIISYHGYNGFGLIRGVVPLSSTVDPPVYHARPLKLLANLEYRIKLLQAEQREQRIIAVQSSSFSDPLQSDYARLYRQLIQLAQTNQIRLVLASYSMAVTGQSDPRLINFYRQRFPAIIWWIKMNQIHSLIVEQLTKQNPEVCFVDTRPHLDGEHDNFIDLVHFNPEGERQIAETMFAGIQGILAKDVGRPTAAAETPAAP
jgi:lysophospholipase L1-like esterase